MSHSPRRMNWPVRKMHCEIRSKDIRLYDNFLLLER